MNGASGSSLRSGSEAVTRLEAAIERRTGLSFHGCRRDDFVRAVDVLTGQDRDLEAIRELLESGADDPIIDDLVQLLTIGETSFFRYAAQFRALEEMVLPELIERRRTEGRYLRLWSAGCSSGEEPYSIAILLKRLLPDIESWTISLLATDINESALAKARRGVYGEWSFRDVPDWIKTLYFERAGDEWALKRDVMRLVDLRYLNLADEGYPSLLSNTNALDIVFCRNVMIYFSPATIAGVARRLWSSLVPGGWLVAGHADIGLDQLAGFELVYLGDSILYRRPKETRAASAERLTGLTPTLAPPSGGIPPSLGRATLERGGCDRSAGTPDELPRFRSHPVDEARRDANAGRIETALALLDGISSDDERAAEAYYLSAVIHLNLGNPGIAADMLRRSLYLRPVEPVVHYLSGVVSLRRGKGRAAERHFRAAATQLESMSAERVIGDDGLTAARLYEVVRGELGLIAGEPGGM
ncbi:MAG: CheR family methyltransferase [Thermoanaerobaculia bacterium]|jgi:chemotaxis protein methyltransferase CheR